MLWNLRVHPLNAVQITSSTTTLMCGRESIDITIEWENLTSHWKQEKQRISWDEPQAYWLQASQRC